MSLTLPAWLARVSVLDVRHSAQPCVQMKPCRGSWSSTGGQTVTLATATMLPGDQLLSQDPVPVVSLSHNAAFMTHQCSNQSVGGPIEASLPRANSEDIHPQVLSTLGLKMHFLIF